MNNYIDLYRTAVKVALYTCTYMYIIHSRYCQLYVNIEVMKFSTNEYFIPIGYIHTCTAIFVHVHICI